MEKFLLALPKWLIFASFLYIAALVSYAVYDNRQVEFFPPKIHPKNVIAIPSPFPNPTPSVDLVALVKKLTYEDPISEEIRDLKDQHKGPWSFSTAAPVNISVLDGIPKGEANVCPEYEEATMELVSNLKDFSSGRKTAVKATDLIMRTKNCRESIGYSMQINCQDAQVIFTKKLIQCEPNSVVVLHPIELKALVGVTTKP